MEEYGVASSWTKVLKIGEGLPRPIGFKRNGEVVLLSYDGQLVSWVPWSTEFKHLEIIGYEDTFVDCYVESLVFARQGCQRYSYILRKLGEDLRDFLMILEEIIFCQMSRKEELPVVQF